MAYVKTVWQNGDIILPEKLNNMEGGIEANDQKQAVLYSAQTLTDAQKAQARENIGVNGGGVSFDDLFPVGSFWWSTEEGSPAAQGLSAGTWEQIQNRFLLAAGTNYVSGATGGASTHVLTVNEIPVHRHNTHAYSGQGTAAGYWTQGWNNASGTDVNNDKTTEVGGGQAHNNMPPYMAAYCWHRVA